MPITCPPVPGTFPFHNVPDSLPAVNLYNELLMRHQVASRHPNTA